MSEKIYIKNMVCPRCISAVESILNQLQVNYREVRLGEVDFDIKLNLFQLNKLSEKLENQGFQLIHDRKTSLVERIKALVIDKIHHNSQLEDFSWASYLNHHLHLDYKYLSSLFSSLENMTLEHYIILQKTERVKELLVYDELTLKEIADQLDYSSSAYLSSQFKQQTGQSPTAYKQSQNNDRKSLDEI
ncbi:MAG: helix-turn-helix domain-containing protein [Psychroflexus halocasei]